MSEHVTHTAVLEDCFNLMYASENIHASFKEVGKKFPQFAQFGSVTRSGDKFTVNLLKDYRSRWETRTAEDRLDYKLVFILGWLSHRAADRQMKPVFREHEPESTEFPTDCSIYHDAFIFSELYAKRHNTPFHFEMASFEKGIESLPIAAEFNITALTDFYRILHQRALIEMHTFIPDTENIEGWMDKLYARHQEQIIHMDRYANAIVTPDPAKVKRFVVEPNFYDRNEPILQLTAALRNGAEVSQQELAAVLDTEPRSHYAIAIKTGFHYIYNASQFFSGNLEEEALRDKLDIGKKGRDGISV
ncbi:hypothetical protein [Paenibacillus radicis (ex Xue et al. 2023)]|uniref:Phospholipase C/D domain-containing protein n=1 Tax=Paenibacillus radicis (ex Xue et al. 2023) TaxID=2972489 RepID=A0ABT1YJZ1_9BACL|nr:hypothetical protein [Paenibacillus radicis (ex Xue et al. 2023)]MCR8633282.1 hypothetical protein [Paenibacillus radicis (ex Xue et al. 2023)]